LCFLFQVSLFAENEVKKNQILKDLYFSNISPSGKSFDRNSLYGKKLKTVSDTEEKFLALLNNSEKELLVCFSDANGNMSRIVVAD